jgi:hypothetical protein
MDKSVIKDSLGQVERELEDARRAAQELDDTMWDEEDHSRRDRNTHDTLSWSLGKAFEMLALVLEAGGLADTRTRLIEQWNKFEKKDLGATIRGDSFAVLRRIFLLPVDLRAACRSLREVDGRAVVH